MSYSEGAQSLVQVVQKLSSARSLEDITCLVRTAAREIADADGATFVLNDNDAFCFYADEDAISPLWKGQRFPQATCVSGWAMQHHEAVIIEDIYKDPRVPIDAYRPTFVKSLTMMPIRKDSPLGAIGTYWKETHRPSDELKKANDAKNEFLTVLSHELRTPLNSIVGWSEILSETNSPDPDVTEGALAIFRNAKIQSHLIDDLLDLSQMLSGRFEVLEEKIDLVHAIQNVLELIRPEALAKKISISFINNLPSAYVLGESARVEQMIFNLLSNSVKFSGDGKQIIVKLMRAGPQFHIEVNDQGIGISSEMLPHVFENFKQADGTLTRKYGGLGIGLALVKNLAEAHHGSVAAKSDGPGQGATFTISLPAIF